MTALDPSTPTERAPLGGGGPGWRPVATAGDMLACAQRHGRDGGSLDESARRLSHDEYAVARLLEAEGHTVRSVPESRGGGRTPDLMACDTPVEVKSFVPLAERRREPSLHSVVNKLLSARDQAAHVVLVGRGSGLTVSAARAGLARYEALGRADPGLRSVRVLGEGYDVAWTRSTARSLDRPLDPSGRRPGMGREMGP